MGTRNESSECWRGNLRKLKLDLSQNFLPEAGAMRWAVADNSDMRGAAVKGLLGELDKSYWPLHCISLMLSGMVSVPCVAVHLQNKSETQ